MAINFSSTFGLIPIELNVRRQSILFSRFSCNATTDITSVTAVETLKTSSSASGTVSKPFQKPQPPPPPKPQPPSPLSSPATLNPNMNDEKGISQIQVPRQKYIHVSKSRLLDSLLLSLRDINGGGSGDGDDENEDENDLVSQFTRITSCLDAIIHAEHKRILEEMRLDYFACQSIGNEGVGGGVGEGEGEEEGEVDSGESVIGRTGTGIDGNENGNGTMELEVENQLPFFNGLDFFQFFNTSDGNSNVDDDARACGIATATRFQRSFMKLLQDAQFEELSVRDLMLTSALNSDYLLTLPINVDWKRAYESNAIIFRRGYSTEKQKGLLIVEKLDYLQSKILQEVFGLIAKPLLQIGIWTKKVIQYAVESEGRPVWVKRIQLLLQEAFLFQEPHNSMEQNADAPSRHDHYSNSDLPIWLAAQKAVSRYEGFLSSIGPRGRLLRKFLGWSGLLPSTPEVPFDFASDKDVNSEPHKRPVFLSRISLGDIWRPATRQYCGNNVWRILKVGFSIIFSRSVLQEPAFQELILLYTEETAVNEIPSLQLKIYEKIPMPDLAVIFPHKKLSFRILDTVRLDIATIIGLLAYVINYKFEDVLSSPSAIMLDVIAVGALAIFLFRVALGYKQTWDRYQLLVNRTLYEKTLASGFGSIHFLLDASEQQQYKECILAYAILLKAEKKQFTSRVSLGEECERFLYNMFKERVQMPVDEAVDRLIRLGLVLEKQMNCHTVLQVVPCSSAYDELKKLWDSLLS